MVKIGPVTKLKQQLLETQEELEQTKSLLLRKAAEFDNARKRWQRDSVYLRFSAQAEVLIGMCEMWDNFERALEITHDGKEEAFESYRKGVELIYSQFTDTLLNYGLKQYSCLGQEFDPARAEAVGHRDSDEAAHGKVIEELKKGFLLGEQVLRPAQVIVARQVKENSKDAQAFEQSKED